MLWLNPVFAKLDDAAEPDGVRPVDAGSLDAGSAAPSARPGANGCRPMACWCRCGPRSEPALGALLLARDQPWSEGDVHLMSELADGYAYAWARFRGRRHRSLLAALFGRGLMVKLAVAAALVGGPVPAGDAVGAGARRSGGVAADHRPRAARGRGRSFRGPAQRAGRGRPVAADARSARHRKQARGRRARRSRSRKPNTARPRSRRCSTTRAARCSRC